MDALRKLQPQVSITKPFSDYTDPVIEIVYEPAPPDFTIRRIISCIVSADPTSFKASLHRPPTLEQRTRSMQLRERRTLIRRLLFTFIFAIPTFIIGVVCMSLMPSGSRTRDYFMGCMWNGNASRIQWSLFFLATPVMFYGAGLFHRRSIKEIVALWRKGSTTPIIKRFTRFGSMNLLVSGPSLIVGCVLIILSRFQREFLLLIFPLSHFLHSLLLSRLLPTEWGIRPRTLMPSFSSQCSSCVVSRHHE
jgi:Cu+-exporting ATPase